MKKLLNLVLILGATFFASCDNNDEEIATSSSLTVNLNGLEALGADYVYEGWIIVNGSPVSTGTFTSVQFPQSFQVNTTDLESATKFVLTIEPAVDPDPAPAATKLLAGDFSGNSASVTADNIVIADNSSVSAFSNASGKYILATPTDSDNTNESSGVWFLDNSNPPAVAGLTLPTLSDGWKYEGWVVVNGTPISTGTFTDPAAADDNAATSPFKGLTGNGPNYPGEDYLMGSFSGINFPIDLKGATVVISVEPSPDNSPAPFTLKPLANQIPANALDHTVLSLATGPTVTLTGTVSR